MGHERVGALPRTKPWSRVVAQIAHASGSDGDVATLARTTLANVRSRLRNIHQDGGVIAAFQFLIALAVSGSADRVRIKPPIDLREDPSPLQLASGLSQWVQAHSRSAEYGDIARRAATDAIALWTEQQKRQLDFTGEAWKASETWRKAGTGSGFCEVARLFFAKFTERYLNYFLCREASAEVSNIEERNQLESRLQDHIDAVSKHAFETARIAQSFAAGWFNRYARAGMPPPEQIERFLAISFGKISEELEREASQE